MRGVTVWLPSCPKPSHPTLPSHPPAQCAFPLLVYGLRNILNFTVSTSDEDIKKGEEDMGKVEIIKDGKVGQVWWLLPCCDQAVPASATPQ